MKLKKFLSGVLAAAVCLTFAACSDNSSSSDNNSSQTGGSSSESSAPDGSANESTPDSSAPEQSSPEQSSPESIKVVALKGPTAMGMTKLMSDDETENYPYDFEIAAAVDEISPMVAQGKADIVCVPANLGSVLYNKTEGGVKALAVNTLGVLYICENGGSVSSVEDLKGKTIFSSGKGATPEYALNFILKSSDIDPEKDVTIEWKSEHAECLAALMATENSVAMLPQPFVATAQSKNESVRVAIDLNDAWNDLNVDSSLLTGIVIARREFAERYPEAVNEFLTRYKASVDYVNNNVDDAAELVGKYGIVPAAVAKKAIPECNIVCVTGAEMKTKLGGYLKVLADNDAKAVGGKLPGDDFYYAYEFPG